VIHRGPHHRPDVTLDDSGEKGSWECGGLGRVRRWNVREGVRRVSCQVGVHPWCGDESTRDVTGWKSRKPMMRRTRYMAVWGTGCFPRPTSGVGADCGCHQNWDSCLSRLLEALLVLVVNRRR